MGALTNLINISGEESSQMVQKSPDRKQMFKECTFALSLTCPHVSVDMEGHILKTQDQNVRTT